MVMGLVGKKVFDDLYLHTSSVDAIEDDAQRSLWAVLSSRCHSLGFFDQPQG
jgi:hypothetical protein